ncbi:putative nuclease HARBI1 [Cinnamomum micranthum f. kanehirae]|uniref:Putative nuclease HARBI1 n=1 Tax=Cinnamomum micranthum f. kanehirae TaxID=337451 RepID=A0A443PB53_9MAGN|nr:putative nuclease HARBI1 [Cinnamomum micranthum f. kanehirae]
MSQNYTDSSSNTTDELWHTVINSDSDEELQILLEAHDPYFQQKRNCASSLGLSALQKVTAAVRKLAYGVMADVVDDYVRIAENTSIELLIKFVQAIIVVFGNEYLRTPNNADICRFLSEGERCGFPRMLGSIDCMH